MSGETRISEREAVMRERQAYELGIQAMCANGARGLCRCASRVFPLPKVERPRVVQDPHGQGEWCVVDGRLHARNATITQDAKWIQWCAFPTPLRVEMWAALLASPTELVDAE